MHWGTAHAPVHGCLVPMHAQTYEQHWKNKGFARWLSGCQALIQALAECCAQPSLNICVILQAVPAMHNAWPAHARMCLRSQQRWQRCTSSLGPARGSDANMHLTMAQQHLQRSMGHHTDWCHPNVAGACCYNWLPPAGGGDAYTRLMAQQRLQRSLGRDSRGDGPIQVKLPQLRPPTPEAVVGELHVPAHPERHADMAYLLNQQPGKLLIRDIKVGCLAEILACILEVAAWLLCLACTSSAG